uniref:Gag protein n=1 Tax=Rhipicephalus zambeziensis TaxID=60191 RepID=A0A224YQ09_9ACAR
MLDLFGKPVGRKMAANKMLASRAQTSTESYVSYIEDVISLCRKANAEMPEADKVGHILKGIADDAFNLLICKNLTTVEDIIKECRRFEQAKSRRIDSVFARLPNTAATSSCEDRARTQPPAPVSPDQVTRIVRREIEAMAPAPAYTGARDTTPITAPMVQAIVRQELASIGLHSVKANALYMCCNNALLPCTCVFCLYGARAHMLHLAGWHYTFPI